VTDQNPPQPPSGGSTGDDEQTSGSGFPPPGGSGSIYESATYHQPPSETPQEQPAPPVSGSAAVPPPVAGSAPPGYEGYPPSAGYPPAGAYAAPPARNNTQLFGILGIVFAVVCCPLLGVLFGWLSMNEAKKTGSDDTLGKVGFWLGIAFTAIALVSVIIAACAGAFGAWDNNY
jgi:hypothetical protein